MLTDNPHIALIHDERVPADFMDQFCTDVNAVSLDVQRIARPAQGPQASIEWLAFPVIAFFLLKPYFDGFMAEAGRDHYAIVRKALKALWSKLFAKNRELRVAVITPSGERKSKYSIMFAIYTFTDTGRLTKLLFREDCREDEYAESIDVFLDFLESYHCGNIQEKQQIDTEEHRTKDGVILVEYDSASKSLRVVSPIPNSRDRDNSAD